MKNLCEIIINIDDDFHHISVKEEGGFFKASDNVIIGNIKNRMTPKYATIFSMLYLNSPMWLTDKEIILNVWSCSTSTWRDKRQSYRVAIHYLKSILPDKFLITKKTNGIKLNIKHEKTTSKQSKKEQ